MSTIQKTGFGFVSDQSEITNTGSKYANFGLNQGFVSLFSYNTNAGKGNSAGDAIDFHVNIEGKEFRRRIYPVGSLYDGKGKLITNENSEEYILAYNVALKGQVAYLVHVCKAIGVQEVTLQNVLNSGQVNTFSDLARALVSLLPVNYSSIPVDIFLEYQWNIQKDQTKTWLEIPKNLKGGAFIIPQVKGEWIKEDSVGLRYVNENGEVHPFRRSSSYMDSNKAKQQVDVKNDRKVDINQPKKSTWD